MRYYPVAELDILFLDLNPFFKKRKLFKLNLGLGFVFTQTISILVTQDDYLNK